MRVRFSLLPLLMTAACSGQSVTDTLGLGKHQAPDEFEVVSRPPLSIPKEFYLQPPDEASVAPPSGMEAHQAARRMVTGLDAGTNDVGLDQAQASQESLADTAAPIVQSSDLASGGDESFLKRIGTEQADPKVRHEIARENGDPERTADPSLLQKMRGVTNEEPVIDAGGEAARLQQNKAEGKSPDAGDTPMNDPSKRSFLQRIFD